MNHYAKFCVKFFSRFFHASFFSCNFFGISAINILNTLAMPLNDAHSGEFFTSGDCQ